MLDDDDLDFAILAWPNGGWIMALIGLVVVIWIAVAVSRNKDECAQKTCANGATSILLNHECLCVERPIDAGAR